MLLYAATQKEGTKRALDQCVRAERHDQAKNLREFRGQDAAPERNDGACEKVLAKRYDALAVLRRTGRGGENSYLYGGCRGIAIKAGQRGSIFAMA